MSTVERVSVNETKIKSLLARTKDLEQDHEKMKEKTTEDKLEMTERLTEFQLFMKSERKKSARRDGIGITLLCGIFIAVVSAAVRLIFYTQV